MLVSAQSWKWGDLWSFFQGLGGLAFAVGAVFAGFRFLRSQIRSPDLIVRVFRRPTRLPSNLLPAATELAVRATAALEYPADGFQGQLRESLREAAHEPEVERLVAYNRPGAGGLSRMDCIEISLENRSKREIRGVGLFLEQAVFAYWNVEISAPFITQQQEVDFAANSEMTDVGTAIMKPPPLPSEKSLTICLYGNLQSPNIHVTVPDGITYRTDNVIPVRETWWMKRFRLEIPYMY
jgi:hypothetical protein